MTYYNQKPKKVYYNFDTDNVSPIKKPNYHKFDSQSEFKLFNTLRQYVSVDFDLIPHKPIDVIGRKKPWKCDFTLRANNEVGIDLLNVLLLKCASVTKTAITALTLENEFTSSMHIEYKGVIDKATINFFNSVFSDKFIADRLVVVTEEPTTLTLATNTGNITVNTLTRQQLDLFFLETDELIYYSC